MVFIISICLCAGIYCLFAIRFSLPKWNASYRIEKSSKTKRVHPLDALAKRIAPCVPVGRLRRIELEKQLKAAGIFETPKEYTAVVWVRLAVWILLAAVCWRLCKPLVLFPAVLGLLSYRKHSRRAIREVKRRAKEVEREIPKFVSYLCGRVHQKCDFITLLDLYIANYDNALTTELQITAADMRTGNQERAITRLQGRIASPLMTELCRGILAAMRGDDVGGYFETLNQKLMTLWGQRLRREALKKQPKINRMSYLLLAAAFVTTFVMLGAVFVQALLMIGGAV